MHTSMSSRWDLLEQWGTRHPKWNRSSRSRSHKVDSEDTADSTGGAASKGGAGDELGSEGFEPLGRSDEPEKNLEPSLHLTRPNLEPVQRVIEVSF